MDRPEIECPACDGHGTRLVPGKLDDADTCTDCDGKGWRPMTDDELAAAAERQAEDAASEPPVAMGEQHRAAWAQKQELRRG